VFLIEAVVKTLKLLVKMSILTRRNAKNAVKTNDFSALTWNDLEKTIVEAETFVGTNSILRYGIATETDVGLPSTKAVLVPVLEDLGTPDNLARMYSAHVPMIGTHELRNKAKAALKEPFPLDRDLAGLARLEEPERKAGMFEASEGDYVISNPVFPHPELIGSLTYICAYLNYQQFRRAYPEIRESFIIAGSHAVAMAYRNGLLESYAAREFQFVRVKIADDGSVSIIGLDPAYAARSNAYWKVNDIIKADQLKMSAQLTELGLGLVVGAGTTHYMMNHSTGGARLGGHNVRALSVNGLYNVEPTGIEVAEIDQTTFYYNVLHPVNKRAVANLCIPASKVNSWYRNYFLPPPAVIYSDTFMAYRQTLVPAGTHKAYVAMLALKSIGDAALLPFLPDPDFPARLINIYREIKNAGARAHVGSRYYTGELPSVTQTDVDSFLPIAAYFVQHKMRNSSLAASPHLSLEHAAGAPERWKNVVDLTTRYSAENAPSDAIVRYLARNGAAGVRYDLSSEDGIGAASDQNALLASDIRRAL